MLTVSCLSGRVSPPARPVIDRHTCLRAPPLHVIYYPRIVVLIQRHAWRSIIPFIEESSGVVRSVRWAHLESYDDAEQEGLAP